METNVSTVIVVTGASRGIGKAIALSLAAPDTALIINCSKSAGRLELVKEEIIKKGALCETFVGDVSNYSTVQDMTPDMWNNIMSVNLNSVYNCCHFAVQDMLRRHCGKIINISSVWGLYGASCEVAYSATKGAINSFTKALAKELAPSNIQVNAIACGAIDTEMNGHLSPEELQELAEEIPCGTLGSPYGVANLAKLILNSDNYLTGQIIQYDGGWI